MKKREKAKKQMQWHLESDAQAAEEAKHYEGIAEAYRDGYAKGQLREREANKDQHDLDMNELNSTFVRGMRAGYEGALGYVLTAGQKLFGMDDHMLKRVMWLIEEVQRKYASDLKAMEEGIRSGEHPS